MRITKVDVIRAKTSSPTWRPVFCRIYTDTGLYGDGEACLAFGRGAVGAFGMLKDLAGMIIGKNPLEVEAIWQQLYQQIVWGYNGGPVVFAAISAIDTALWDIKGKYFKEPLHVLLGGKCRDKLRTYASQLQHGWWPGMYDTDEFVLCASLDDYRKCARTAIEEGYDAVKVDLLELTDDGARMPAQRQDTVLSRQIIDLAERRMEAVREAVGPSVDIIIEAHSHNSATGAVQLCNALEKYGIFYYEEPNTPNPYTAEYIAEHTNVPLASGERIYSRWQYAPYLTNASLRVIQPDIGTTGGITETKKICDMALPFDVSVQLHVCGSPLSTYVALHLQAVIPNFVIHEHNSNLRLRSQLDLTKNIIHPVDGYFTLPQEPGIGTELSEAVFKNAAEWTCVDEVGQADRV